MTKQHQCCCPSLEGSQSLQVEILHLSSLAFRLFRARSIIFTSYRPQLQFHRGFLRCLLVGLFIAMLTLSRPGNNRHGSFKIRLFSSSGWQMKWPTPSPKFAPPFPKCLHIHQISHGPELTLTCCAIPAAPHIVPRPRGVSSAFFLPASTYLALGSDPLPARLHHCGVSLLLQHPLLAGFKRARHLAGRVSATLPMPHATPAATPRTNAHWRSPSPFGDPEPTRSERGVLVGSMVRRDGLPGFK